MKGTSTKFPKKRLLIEITKDNYVPMEEDTPSSHIVLKEDVLFETRATGIDKSEKENAKSY